MSKNIDKKLFFLVFFISLTIFLFTSSAHRFSPDEDQAQLLTKRLVTGQPHPLFIPGQSKMLFEYPQYWPNPPGPVCLNPLLCSEARIGHGVTEYPFVFINHNINNVIHNKIIYTSDDFDDPGYVVWRNSLDSDFILLQLLYGPLILSLSVGVFFLVCRTFYNPRTSVILSLFYGFATTVWAWSHTSMNMVPFVFFSLLGFLFFRRFQNKRQYKNLIFCGGSLGFAFLCRPDSAFFAAVLMVFLLYDIRRDEGRLKKILSFVSPLILSFLITKWIDFLNFGTQGLGLNQGAASQLTGILTITIPFYVGGFGLLLSPGFGLFIFAPILITVFFSFPDFYRKSRFLCLMFLSFITIFVVFYGSIQLWYAGSSWGGRYLLAVIPYMLIPLGTSIEKRNKKIFIILIALGSLGSFFNTAYVIQDVSWFVWSLPGSTHGLYGLGNYDPFLINPTVIWTFENSQLTQSIITAFIHLQPDIFLLKVFGPALYFSALCSAIGVLVYFIIKLMRHPQSHDIQVNAATEIIGVGKDI